MASSKDRKPFDLDALEAEAEESDKPFAFTFAGREWTLGSFGSLDKSLIDSMSGKPDELAMEAFRRALGDDQREDFAVVPMRLDTMNALLTEWAKASGMDLGEGQASTRS